jgi:hypothetical protein
LKDLFGSGLSRLGKQGIKIKPGIIEDFFVFYGIEKKTPDSK